MWDKLKEQFNILKLEKKRIYLITNSDKFESKEIFIDAVASALQGGVDVVELCEKLLPDNVLVEIGQKIRILCDEFGATFIVNGRADIAKIVEADGVRLEYDSVSITAARFILGQNSIVGKTVQNAQDAVDAFNRGYDYLIIDADNEDLNWINSNIELPLFTSGNVTLDNISSYVQSGIKRIVQSEEIMYSQIPERTARQYLKFLP